MAVLCCFCLLVLVAADLSFSRVVFAMEGSPAASIVSVFVRVSLSLSLSLCLWNAKG